MNENKHPRDRETGRYVHEWGVIGDQGSLEVSECQFCGKVRAYGWKNGLFRELDYKNREAARKAGEILIEGY